jgi:2-C-methyl-D-erythritol 2,4-cyclodiphosphate synthase
VSVPAVRIGQGMDVHPFSEDPARRLVLGGVPIPDAPGLAGHSDADVVLHALADALLGAAGLGDIGALFGTCAPEYEGADSQVFLAGALARVHDAGWRVGNVDLTIVAERPRLAGARDAIASSLARLLGAASDAVNVKATTTDGLGFVGRGEGIACTVVVLLTREDST